MAVITDSTPGKISARWFCDYRGCGAKSEKVHYRTRSKAEVATQKQLDKHRINKHRGQAWRGVKTTVNDLRNRKKRERRHFVSRKKLRRVIARSGKF